MNEYNTQLKELDNPYNCSTNIEYAVSAKLNTLPDDEQATWLAESITEQANQVSMTALKTFLDKDDSEASHSFAYCLKVRLCEYMRGVIQDDWDAYNEQISQQKQYEKEAAEDYAYEQHKDKRRGL